MINGTVSGSEETTGFSILPEEAINREEEALAALISALADEVDHFTRGGGGDFESAVEEFVLYNDSLLRTMDSLCMMGWIMVKKRQALHQVNSLGEVSS